MSNREASIFRWVTLGVAVLATGLLLWMLNDVRREHKKTSRIVNKSLPTILENVKTSSEALALLAEDIKRLQNLAGSKDRARDRSLVVYADGVLDLLQKQKGQIGLTKKIFGSGLKQLRPIAEWVRGARKEAIWLTFRANSKRELLERLCQNKFGSDWMIVIEGQPAARLIDWLRKNHPATAKLKSK